jgi:hypothetical protein
MKGPSFATRPAWLTRQEQARYRGLLPDRPSEAPQVRAATAGATVVLTQDVWYEEQLGPDWVAAYRLSFQDKGSRLVIGELRIFPSAGPREPFSGRWLGDVLGSDAPVPTGGLTARLYRTLKLRGFVPFLSSLFQHAQLPLRFAPPPVVTRTRRGRKPKPDVFYARVAVLYERAYMGGKTYPTSEVARTLKLTPGAARSAVAGARRRGFLTPTERGRASGRASADARQLAGRRPTAAVAPGRSATPRLQPLATKVESGGTKTPQVPVSVRKNARQSPGGTDGR